MGTVCIRDSLLRPLDQRLFKIILVNMAYIKGFKDILAKIRINIATYVTYVTL